ncbi:hypothetical protein BJ993_004109 [Nocardioides aromaticivorans]|uniref:Uncharacterized protein n=1 Tax=Nocardioides aromaticivorans TaxID=200618 RepID=A0A7Y9ZKB5_9ACTN|nr:hypothetical protein [Nocardioides aromaticivorans]NYI47029.1 hypothetical protein [Nocardioides aromaticivorans]
MPNLQVTDEQAWLAALGVMPQVEESSGDDFVQELIVPIADSEELRITWDLTDDSVRIRHQRGGSIVSDLFREMATLLTVLRQDAVREVVVEYGSTGWAGRTRVQVLPEVRIHDEVLRS